MRMPFMRRARRIARRLGKGSRNGALILLYHRVAEVRPDPWALAVSPQHFGEHLEALRKHFQPITLRQLADGLRDGGLPPRSVAVTLDDGYSDNLSNAKPLLERYGVPATVFLVTGYMGRRREFWWDELEKLLLQPGVLPAELQLNIGGEERRWQLEDAANYDEEASRWHLAWAAWEGDCPTRRHSLYRELWELLHGLTDRERQGVLDALAGWAGADSAARGSHRSLQPEEIVELARGETIEVGAHTVTHSALATLPFDAQREEIVASKSRWDVHHASPALSCFTPRTRRRPG